MRDTTAALIREVEASRLDVAFVSASGRRPAATAEGPLPAAALALSAAGRRSELQQLTAMAVVCAAAEVDVLVTDGSVPKEVAAALRGEGVELLPV